MESMRRSEANSSHHPNKVAVNSVVTESNNKSSGSGPLNNNSKINYNLQQQHLKSQLSSTISLKPAHLTTKLISSSSSGSSTPHSSNSSAQNTSATTTSSSTSSTSSESKDTNFEYDDNEWDVGGIGDLLIDLDADIEKSASTTSGAQQAQSGSADNTLPQISAKNTASNLVAGKISNNSSSGQHLQKDSNINANEQIQPGAICSSFSSSTSLSSRSSSSNSLSSATSSSTSANSSPIKPIQAAISPPKSTNYPTIQGGILQKSLSAPTTTAYSSTSSSSILSPSILAPSTKTSSYKHSQQHSKGSNIAPNSHQSLKLQQPSLVAQLNNKSPASIDSSNPARFHSNLSATNTNLSQKSGTSSNILNKDTKASTSTTTNVNTSGPISSASSGQNSSPLGNSSAVSANSSNIYPIGIQSASSNTGNSSMSSQPSGGQGAGKAATKMSIDHQATLDKGLKMKIKRTKPGTKTSEAKHEIVKAEQNGTSAGLDVENNSSSGQQNSLLQNMNSSVGGNTGTSGGGKNKHNNQINQSSPVVQQQLSSVQASNTPTTNKRGSSGHRRDKAREKQPHSRDKSEHNSNNSNSSNSSSSNSSATSSLSNSTNNDRSATASSGTANSSSASCNCSHELNGNSSSNIQNNCSSVNCIRNRSSSNNSLDQSLPNRLTGQNQSNNISAQNISSSGINNSSSSNSIGLFNSSNNSTTNSNSNSIQTSSTNAPNAPGPPAKTESKSNIINNNSGLPQQQQQNATQMSNLGINNSQQLQTNNINNVNNSSNNNASGHQQNSINSLKTSNSGHISATMHHTISVNSNSPLAAGIKTNCDDGAQSPPAKRIKTESKDMVDVCIGTSVGTITEPDCLGPCEPGTSVTLEGIVWHETEGGVLVVNVTWRGKTYVGTLLDCTRHDWAPPRFCDSPTEELDSRTPKGRAKRGRSANLTPDLSNFTETRSSVHSKLRNGGAKGRGARTTTTGTASSTTSTTTTSTASSNGNGLLTTTTVANASGIAISSSTSNTCNTPSPSPTGFLPPRSEKRKSKDESPSPVNGESATLNSDSSQNVNSNGQSTQIIVNPITGLNVQISNKKCKTASPCAISPVLLECPEQDCNKKYKHANGLRYHQSHAHGSGGSMDEDSSTLPESPIRVAPPTTPSPAPPCTPPVQQINSTSAVSISGESGTTVASATLTSSINSTTPLTATIPTVTSVPTTPTLAPVVITTIPNPTQTATTTVSSNAPISAPGLLTLGNSAPTLIAPIPITPVASMQPQNVSQHSIAGGSITSGISNQALSAQQHQQMQQQQMQQQQMQQQLLQSQSTVQTHPMLVGVQNSGPTVPNQSGLLPSGQALTEQQTNGQGIPPLLQQPPPNLHSGLLTPTRGDQPIKPGVLRFVPPTADPTNPSNLTNQQSPIRPSNLGPLNPNNVPESSPYGPPPSQQGIPVKQNQSFSKQKKNRKSPVPGEFETTVSRDDAHSPAYSDISDDSPSTENDLTIDKTKPPQMQDMVKKSHETGAPPPIPALGGYGMYQFYAQQPYMMPPQTDHQGGLQGVAKLTASQPNPNSGPAISSDFNKSKDPPLDLMTKPTNSQINDPASKESPISNPPSQPIGMGPGPPGKPIPHFYPFNYMPAGYPYNVDPSYGPVPMVSDDGKISSGPSNQPPPTLKDDRTKESPSPHGLHDIGKLTGQSSQMITNKMINQQKEQQMKDMNKDQNNHGLHPKEPNVQSLGYPGLYQRHPSLGVPPQSIPPTHLSRDEELRRYYMYPDQRRSNQQPSNNNPTITTIKEEPQSPQSAQNLHHSSPQTQQQQAQQMSQSPQQMQSQNSGPSKPTKPSPQQSPMSSSVNQKATNLIKDIKEEKEVKIKQEGQKPTMETQGPPPPPTSQYFLHPSYISPGPFGFDPNHPVYRNVLMSAGPYNAPPYHLPMARYHAPEDLSRNPGTKALDALHHAASQYYTTHKIHELSERAIKSPTSNNNNSGGIGANPKVSNVSSPNIPQSGNGPSGMSVGGPNSGGGPNGPNGSQSGHMSSSSGGPGVNGGGSGGSMNLQPPSGPSGPMGGLGGPGGPPPMNKGDTGKSNNDPLVGKPMSGGPPPGSIGGPGGLGGPGGPDSRSPPPQRHVHTHHHTHVGLGYPMYPAPYGAAVLASQQAAAVAVINPFPPGPAK